MSALTPDEINRRVAEILGYTPCPKMACAYHWKDPQGNECRQPIFTEDLNACASMEATLTDEEYEIFIDVLLDLTGKAAMEAGTKDLGEHSPNGPQQWGIKIPSGNWRTESAPAKLRVQAFIRAKTARPRVHQGA